MTVYLDANILVGQFLPDALSGRVRIAIGQTGGSRIVSNFAATEFAAVVTRRMRMREFSAATAETVLARFDRWCAEFTGRVDVVADDIKAAEKLVRRLDTGLRAPDAIHAAIVVRLECQLLTFDRGLIAATRLLGIPLVDTD